MKKMKLHGKTRIPKQITNEAFVSEPRDIIPEWRRTLSVITFNDAVKILISRKKLRKGKNEGNLFFCYFFLHADWPYIGHGYNN